MTKLSDKILADLNGDLALEYSAAIQYVQHYGSLKGAEYGTIREQYSEHSQQELGHALVLSDLIQYYGGVPVATPSKISPSTENGMILKLDLTSEEIAIGRYRQRVKQVEEAGYYELGTVIRGILKDELDHANDIKLAMGK